MDTEGKRLVLDEKGRIAVESFAVVPPADNQMVVRVACSQISAGSEMNTILQRRQATPAPGTAFPGRGLGYTTVGRIMALGQAVTGWEIGERVLCFGHHGSHWTITLDGQDGGSGAIPNQNLVERIPEGLSDTEAAFAVLGDVALHGLRRARIQMGESVAVHGLGAVGLLAVQLARQSGAWPVIGVDIVPARLQLARELGASQVVDASSTDAVAAIHALTRLPRTWKGWLPGVVPGTGAEVQIQTSSNIQIYNTMLRAAADRGRLVMVGAAQHSVEIGAHELLRRELAVYGSYQTGQLEPHPYWPWTRARNRAIIMDMIGRGDLQVQPLVSHMVPGTEAATLYDLMAQGGSGWLSVFLAWD